MLSVTCPSCRANIHLLEQLAGKTIRCKQCQQIFTVGALPKAPEPRTPEPRRPAPPPQDVPVVHPISKGPTPRPDPLREGLQSRPGRVPTPVVKPAKPKAPPTPQPQAPPQSQHLSGTSHAWLIGGGAVGALLLVGLGIAIALILRNPGSQGRDSKQEGPVAQSLVDPIREPRRESPATQLAREEIRPSQPTKQEPSPPPPTTREEVPSQPPASPPANPSPKPAERAEPKKETPSPAPMTGDNTGSIPVALLEHLKSATVFVKVESKDFGASGSGFVMKVQGNTAYIVTNAHVIDPKIEIEITVPRNSGPGIGMPQMPRFGPANFPRGPMGPRGPFGPRGPSMIPPSVSNPVQQGGGETRTVVVPFGNATISLVFWSGTKQEQSYRAVVAASDAKRDLAILKVTGLRNAPQPIDCSQSLKLQETMPIFAFGFPFGELTPIRKGNPEITVSKGSISSIRRDEKEVEGEAISPGSSGGPVVDSQGRLVGIHVMSIARKLHLAIPAEKLVTMLQNKPDAVPNAEISARKIFERQPRVYLSDLEEFDVKSGPWPVSKSGQLGDPENKIIQVNGYRSLNGLSMHPPDGDYAAASYRLDKQASLFRAEVALNDSTNLVLSAAVFEVWGDGKRLWQSKPVNQPRHSHRCRVDVSGVDVLELRVNSTGSHVGLHAVWYEPRLLEKANTPDK